MLTHEDQKCKDLVFQSIKKARLCDILYSVQTPLFVLVQGTTGLAGVLAVDPHGHASTADYREFLRFMMGICTV